MPEAGGTIRTSTSTPFALILRTLALADFGRAPNGPGVSAPSSCRSPGLGMLAMRARNASLNALTSGGTASGLNRPGCSGFSFVIGLLRSDGQVLQSRRDLGGQQLQRAPPGLGLVEVVEAQDQQGPEAADLVVQLLDLAGDGLG